MPSVRPATPAHAAGSICKYVRNHRACVRWHLCIRPAHAPPQHMLHTAGMQKGAVADIDICNSALVMRYVGNVTHSHAHEASAAVLPSSLPSEASVAVFALEPARRGISRSFVLEPARRGISHGFVLKPARRGISRSFVHPSARRDVSRGFCPRANPARRQPRFCP